MKNSKELKTRELLSRKKDDIAQKRRVQEILRWKTVIEIGTESEKID